MSNRYGLYSCAFDAGANTLVLNQVRSTGLRTNKGMFTVHQSGSIDPAAHLMSTSRPVIQVATHDLQTVFAHATAPVSISAGLYAVQGGTFMYRRRLEGGAFDTGSNHIVQTVESGFLHVTEFGSDAESQTPVEATLEFMSLSLDGGNPFAQSNGQAIPVVLTTPAYNSVYYFGPVYLNGVALPGLISSRVRPGIVYTARCADGGAFPRGAASSITARVPMIQLDFLNLDLLASTIGLFTSAFATTLAVYYQKGAQDSEGRVAAGSASHVRVSAAAGSWGPDDVTVQDNDDGTTSVMVMPTGTLSLSAVSTIPS